MPRIAVIGANGKIGTELCLLLAGTSDVSVVPVCRNRFGSGFLRYQGVACRHGSLTDPQQAASILGDCDIVVNLALAVGGRPSEARRQNRVLIENSILFSASAARIVYFSTAMVYGDPRPSARIRWRDHYGREKLRGERLARRAAARRGSELYVLRPGHVLGELQSFSFQARELIAEGPIATADPERSSNAVYMVTVADAILKIVAGRERPGTYDLMCRPEWSWRQVLEHEAKRAGTIVRFERSAASSSARGPLRALGRRTVRAIAGRAELKELATSLVARVSPRLNRRIQAQHYRSRVGGEIDELRRSDRPSSLQEKLTWRPLAHRTMTSLEETQRLLDHTPSVLERPIPGVRWPADLPPAVASLPR